MEFLQLVMILISIIIAMRYPERERWAYGILMASWVFMIYFYVGHKSAALLTIMNL